MSLRRIDARFLLPRHPRTAIVAGGSTDWADALSEAGIDVMSRPSSDLPADLAVGPTSLVESLVSTRAPMLVLEGRGNPGRRLRAAGYSTRRYVPAPGIDHPENLVPLGTPRVAAHAVASVAGDASRLSALLNQAASRALGAGVAPPGRETITVAARGAPTPFVMAAATPFAVPADARFWVHLGARDRGVAPRGAFLTFGTGSREPDWIVKFARTPGAADDFVRERRAHALVARRPVAAAKAPTLLAGFDVSGFPASIETAARGRRLDRVLASTRRRRGEKLAIVDDICSWLIAVGQETSGPAGGASRLWERVEPDLRRAWLAPPEATEVRRAVAATPACMVHSDLAAGNVFTTLRDFTVIDWTDSVERGLPLWDTWALLISCLPIVDGLPDTSEWLAHGLRVFLGDAPSSAVLFEATRRAVNHLGLPAASVGPLACGFWHVAVLNELRRLDAGGVADSSARSSLERVALGWSGHPALGLGWDRWQV